MKLKLKFSMEDLPSTINSEGLTTSFKKDYINYFLKGGEFFKKTADDMLSLGHIRAKLLDIKPLTKEALVLRAINNENAIDVYRARLKNGGAEIVAKEGRANYPIKDIKVVLDEGTLMNKVRELDNLEHPLPANLTDLELDTIGLLKLDYEAGGLTYEVESELEWLLKDKSLKDYDLILDYIYTPDSEKLRNWKRQLSSTHSSGYSYKNFVWAPNKQTLETAVFPKEKISRAADINYWQVTLPHEFEHAFLDGYKVYMQKFSPKHAISPKDLHMGNYSDKLLKAMWKEMGELIGFDPSKVKSDDVREYLTEITELLARGTQIKNWLGIIDPHYKLTAKDLKEASAYYVATGINNNMFDFFKSIIDYDKAAKFLSYATVALPAVGETALYFNNDGSPKQVPVSKQGGVIPKYSVGAAIKKFVNADLSSLVKIPEASKVVRASGATSIIGKTATEHLQKAAKVTGDKRIQLLADFTKVCREKGIKLPEEFNSFIDSIFKTPTIRTVDTKKIRVGKVKTAGPEIVKWHNLQLERPTWERVHYKYQTIHDDAYKRDTIKFIRDIPDTPEKLAEISPKLDEAIAGLLSIVDGNFKLTESMLDEIYLKSRNSVLNFVDSEKNTKKLRKFFSTIESKRLNDYLLLDGFEPAWNKNKEQVLEYYNGLQNIKWIKLLLEFAQTYADKNPDIFGINPVVKLLPKIIYPKNRLVAVYTKYPDGISFLGLDKTHPTSTFRMNKLSPSFSIGQVFTANGIEIPAMPTITFLQHHSKPLALMESEAYLQNPNPESTYDFIKTYQNQRTINGSKRDHYRRFWPLTQEDHIAVHANDDLSLQALSRIKALSLSGQFKNIDEVLSYYDDLMKKQESLARSALK